MAKVPFSKLQANLKADVIECYYNNKNNEPIIFEVKTYLPFKEKLELVQRIINQSVDENGFYNPMRVDLYLTLEFVYAYTNLNFTEKMKEDPFKLYDLIVSNNINFEVIKNTDEKEYEKIKNDVYNTIENIYKYRNSVLGILDAVSSDYSNLKLDAAEIKEQLSNENNLKLIRDIVTKLG